MVRWWEVGGRAWPFEIKAHPRNKGCRNTKALYTPSTSPVTNSCYQTCHILFMSCGVPGRNKESKAPNHHYGIGKDKIVIIVTFLKNS